MAEVLIVGGILLAFAAGWCLCSLMTMAKLTDLDSTNEELARMLDNERAVECNLRERIAEHVQRCINCREGYEARLKEKEA